MLFSGKENVFMYLVAFQKMFRKIFSDVWLCSWKYHRKHIFYLLLTFSHIFSVSKRIYNIIHSSKHKQNPEKNHQIRTLRAIGAVPVMSTDGTVPVMSRSLLSFSLSLFLSLSSIFFSVAFHLKWKWKRKWFSVVLALIFGQLEMLFSLTKFEVTTKHPIFR